MNFLGQIYPDEGTRLVIVHYFFGWQTQQRASPAHALCICQVTPTPQTPNPPPPQPPNLKAVTDNSLGAEVDEAAGKLPVRMRKKASGIWDTCSISCARRTSHTYLFT